MTKDWDAVQEEIKELSFNQKKPLEEVKELMERKHNFRASTRAYRMKLKDWGFMRHKPRRTTKDRNKTSDTNTTAREDDEQRERDSSGTIEPMSATACEKQGGWQVVANADVEAEPTFMGLLSRSRDLQPSFDPLAMARTRASNIVLDMLGAMLDRDSQKLESLIAEDLNHINDPIGMPFDGPNSRFSGHPALSQMVILQHPDQTLLDIACGMPCGPVIWILLAHGAKSSKHPLGTDLALHNAIKNGRPYTVQALLVPGRSDVNGLAESTWRPLRQAVFCNVPDVVRILLSRGANVDDSGPSPFSMGSYTALQLALDYRVTKYMDPPAKERCHQTLKLLLEAGADVHRAPAEGSTQTSFEVFIRPWQGVPYWAAGLTETELDCFRLLVSKGADVQTQLDGYPCQSPWSRTFEHQVLWHSTPSVARLLIDSFVVNPQNCSGLLHDLLGSCPDAKRHPADTLRDIEVLLGKGMNPNFTDINGLTPLEKCINLCPAVDLVARLRMLLENGADPELDGYSGVPLYVIAARTFEAPLLVEVMQALVSKIRGRYTRLVDGISHTWPEGIFPISETQSYEQVMSCTRNTGDFVLNMRQMVPEDVQSSFQRGYFSVVSKNYLDTMTKVAKRKMLDHNEKNEIVWIISMRKHADYPEYKFDQELIVALLDPQPFPSMFLEPVAETTTTSATLLDSTSSAISSPTSSLTITSTAASPPVHVPFQFNPNSSSTTPNLTIPTSTSPSQNEVPSSAECDFVPMITQIRWKDPCATPRPDDLRRTVASVLEAGKASCGT
ncbi:hypothetical protein N0V83_009701 [Neocucurbitaria cava]|uniref:Clr5 domain-containing protein n=1 Tax=Neocucurbitaria cava TaxID=798079 RepID=A0A9W8XYV0_9PLEO|nr:hypothetical protein N0V83_009701 [Neocucurbitaria cava]